MPANLTKAQREERDRQILASAPGWLLKAIACPKCSRECVRSPSGFMTCGSVPAHMGLIMKPDANKTIGAAFDKVAEKDRGPIRSARGACRMAWRVMRIRFQVLIAKTLQVGGTAKE